MEKKAETQENIQKRIRQLVVLDRISFLNSLDLAALDKGTILDLQHQTIFRIIAESNPSELPKILDRYIQSPASRPEYYQIALANCLSDLKGSSTQKRDAINPARIAGGFSYTSSVIDETLKPFVALSVQMRKRDPEAIAFSSPQGFCYFPSENIRHDPETDIKTVHGSYYSSVGGMMYYGFNTTIAEPSYLQKHPVHVLAQTCTAMVRHAEHLMGQATFPQNLMLAELVAYSQETPNWSDRVESDIARFLIAHENGHDPSHPGNRTLFDIMDELNIPHTDFYNIDFPSNDDLKSWDRIRAGQGRPRDVLFLLGDFLANMAIIEDSIGHPSHRLLRAFNWWLVKKPTINARPRGLTTFLSQSYHYDPESHRDMLRAILLSATQYPDTLEKELRNLESLGWAFIEKSNISPHNIKGMIAA